jgi:hypothetical protein
MIIINEKNYKQLNKIHHVDNPIENPDIVLYTEIFNKECVKKLTEVLYKLKLDKSRIFFADNPEYKSGDKISVRHFPEYIENIRDDIENITKRSFNACLVTKFKQGDKWERLEDKYMGYDFIIPSIYIGNKLPVNIKSIENINIKSFDLLSGSLFVQRETVQKYWDIEIPSIPYGDCYILSFVRVIEKYDINPCLVNVKQTLKKVQIPYDLSKIYLSSKLRTAFNKKIKGGISNIHSVKEGSQCFMKNGINEISKYINIGKLIGTGDWGNVYSASLIGDKNCKRKFAIKMARITEEDFKDPYTETSSAWYEIWMLKDIMKPLIERNICPNLPLFIDTFLCDRCDFIFRKGDKQHPCVITVMELAKSDMREYLKFYRHSTEELYSALFQVMAGLHAIQMSGQILNNDIKSKNILVYDVKPGGYWHYSIYKKDFFVPNFGKMFVLNDFGVSTLYDPNFQLYPNKERKIFNVGSRFAININGIFSPIEATMEYSNDYLRKTNKIKWLDTNDNSLHKTSYGSTYKIDRKTGQVISSSTLLTDIQKSYLFRKGVTTNPKTWGFFEHPNIIPPFEFYNDVQDTLRTFIGGKRTTQKGDHMLYGSIPSKVVKEIKPYLGKAENAKKREFSLHSYHVLAGDFITKFFTETHNYQIIPSGKKISYYDMDKCLKSNKF